MMQRLLIATSNPGKQKETMEVLAGHGLEFATLGDFPDVPQPEETGKTFEENAVLKAKYYSERTGLPAIADDGGIEVDALDGAPGVMSHRWLGPDATDYDRAKGILERLEGVPREKRGARIGACTALWTGKELFTSTHFNEGYITEDPLAMEEITSGLPYRKILIVSEFGKLYSDLTQEEHEAINHRRANLRELLPRILEHLGAA